MKGAGSERRDKRKCIVTEAEHWVFTSSLSEVLRDVLSVNHGAALL